MANRKVDKILLKKSGVIGKIPTALDLGELAVNFADAKLYVSGTTANSILPIGWDRISRTGDTVTGDFIINGSISATTYQNLPIDIRVTGGTYSSGTAIFTNNTGGTFSVSGFSTGGSGGTNTYITGGTFSSSTNTLILNRNDDLNVLVTGFTSSVTGNTSVNFSFSGGLESDFTSTIINNTNIKSTSAVIYRVTPSTDHNEIEDSLLDGLIFNEGDIIDGVSFTLNTYAINNTWGVYNIFYKIIN
jgi:hypothetical protein